MRTPRAVAVAIAATALALPVALAAPAEATTTERIVFSGEIAYGEWSTCPTWEAGASCVFTQTTAALSCERELNDFLDPTQVGRYLHDAGPTLIVRHYWFDVGVDEQGELVAVPTKESLGGVGTTASFPATPGNPEVQLDTRLRSGTGTARAITMKTFDYANDRELWEQDEAVVTRWSGVGDLERVDEGQVGMTTGRTVLRDRTSGFMRDVTATGTDSMAGDWGTFLGGYLFHGLQTHSGSIRGHLAGQVAQTIDAMMVGTAPAPARETGESVYGEASWTTCPSPEVGDRCRDTQVWYTGTTPRGGVATTTAGLEVADYEVLGVEDGWVDRRDLLVVSTTVTGARLEAPRDLSSASLTVLDAPAQACDADLVCTDVQVSLTASWTGAGAPVRFASRGLVWGDWGREWSHVQGTTRTGTATATLSGLPSALGVNGPVTGAQYASLSELVERHQLISRS